MLPPNLLIPWGPGALYAELYLGLCQAFAAPWLRAWGWGPGAPRCPVPPTSPAAARPLPADAPATSQSAPGGATIIPFDRTRARAAARP